MIAIPRPLASLSICAALVAFGCTKGKAELRVEDGATIDLIVAEDVRASKAMAAADSAARKGDAPAALDAVDNRARPAIEAGLGLTAAANPKTDWGRARRDTFARILEDRRAALGPYREAVTSGDPEKLIAAIEAQAKIERRALDAVADAHP